MQLTESAWKEISRQAEKSGRERWVQFLVSGGGCNGFQYGMVWMEPLVAFTNDNHLLEHHIYKNAKVFVDPKSYLFVSEMTLDFSPFKGFIFDNPKTTSTCGCGKSVGF